MKNSAHKRRYVLFIVMAVILVLATCTVTLARYITSTENYVEMLSSDFHISSDLLELDNVSTPSYEVADMRRCGLHFNIYNYEKENTALIAAENIEYDIDAEGWSVEVWDGNTKLSKNAAGHYVMPASTSQHEYKVKLNPTSASKHQDRVKATVTTVSPYKVTLQGNFTLTNSTIPEYQVENFANHVLLTVRSNNYAGDFTVKWSSKYSPDNTNALMENWVDTTPSNTIKLTPNTVYKMIFFKNTTTTYNANWTSGIEAHIG